ncbi:NLI interacting factor-like phosphatase [Bacteriovorax sp. Seq25_V]|nr:NLI interacting factor-like phosphatase [Bacteriovorax sp. Seq25_V]
MQSKPKAIIVDLDGTLCDLSHRVHFVENPKNGVKDWESFFLGISEDQINLWCQEVIEAFLDRGYEILFVTGREESYRKITTDWLEKYKVRYQKLFMREHGDRREDSDVKVDIYQKEIENKYETLFVLDDRKSVVKAWRDLGLVCLQCDEGDF